MKHYSKAQVISPTHLKGYHHEAHKFNGLWQITGRNGGVFHNLAGDTDTDILFAIIFTRDYLTGAAEVIEFRDAPCVYCNAETTVNAICATCLIVLCSLVTLRSSYQRFYVIEEEVYERVPGRGWLINQPLQPPVIGDLRCLGFIPDPRFNCLVSFTATIQPTGLPHE